jgi:serine/threonine-protein kinase
MSDVAPSADHFRDALEAALTPAYALGRELGGGGMSRVFLAEERALGRTVVVKVLPPDLAAGVNRERFRREIQLAARLQHPHIVPLLAAGEVEGSLYYTMPYIEGESVRAALARRRRFSVRDVVRVLHDVVDALAYAHARGIVHRDVKPGNVLLQGAHALVTDFGVAKALSAARAGHGTGSAGDPLLTGTGATSTGLAIGTPAYMAPEQLAADPAADHRVDLYAAGLLAYELCTGASPFVADSPRATLAAQLTRMPEPLHQLRPDVPPALSDVIMRCLAKEPGDRPPTAEALLADLEAAVMGARRGALPETAPAGGDRGWAAGVDAAFAGTTPGSGGSTPVTGTPADAARTAPANQLVPAGTAATAAVAAPTTTVGPAERRHAWLVAGLVAGAGLSLLAGVAFSRARQGTPVPPPAPPLPAVAAAAPAGPPTVAAAVPAPAAAPAPARATLSRDDSLAIAAAVERRLAAEADARRRREARPLAPAEAEALRAEAWRRYGDSVRASVERQFGPEFQRSMEGIAAHAGRAAGAPRTVVIPLPPEAGGGATRVFVAPPGPPPAAGAAAAAAAAAALAADPLVGRLAARVPRPRSGVRRVTVLDLTDGTGRPELRAVAAAVSEGLRARVAALDGYDQPDAGATREAARLGLPLPAAAVATHAGAAVGGTVFLRRDTVAQVTLLVFDAERGYPRQVRGSAPVRPGDDPGAVAAALLAAVAEAFPAALERVKWKENAEAAPP